jgi:hypothetical protein
MTILTLISWLGMHGCTLACASGIAANLEAESGLDPKVVGPSGIGLAQWSGNRRRRLVCLFSDQWREPELQVAFMVTELEEMGLRDRLFGMTDPGEAAKVFMLRFERPKQRNPARRVARARALYSELLMSSTAMVIQ